MGKVGVYLPDERKENSMRSKGISRAQLLADARRAASGRGVKPRAHTGLVIALSTVFGSGLAYAVLKLMGI